MKAMDRTTDRPLKLGPQSGFNLLAMSILLTVAAYIMASVIQGGKAGDYNYKAMANIQKLDKVEESMKAYMAKNGHRPCPASGQYAVSSANFGIEATNGGSCLDGTGGTPVADFSGTSYTPTGDTTSGSAVIINISSTTGLSPGLSASGSGIPANVYILSVDSGTQVTLNAAATATASGVSLTFTNEVVGGVIPTKTLGLPDDYALDEFGRRFTYVVDVRATEKKSCSNLQGIALTGNGLTMGSDKGGVAVESSTGSTLIDQTMYAYISHGTDGHGAFPAQGSTVANRINTGNTDADKLTNAGVDSSFNYSTSNFTNVKVRKEKTATFDDMIYYADYLKNTCCVGPVCTPPGFRIDGVAGAAYRLGYQVVTGDINGDGIPDLVITNLFSADVYVVFGGSGTWPDTVNVADLNGSTGVNGTNGFKIIHLNTGDNGTTVAVGDVNGDGVDDLVIGGWSQTYVILGGTGSWPAVVDVNNLNGSTGVNGTSGTNISNWMDVGHTILLLGGPAWVTVGNFNGATNGGTPLKDIAVAGGDYYGSNPNGLGFVLFGHANPWPATMDIYTALDGTAGFEMTSSDTHYVFGDGSCCVTAGDITGDGKDELFINGRHSNLGTTSQGNTEAALFVLYGRASGWPATFDIANEIKTASGKASAFTSTAAYDVYFGGGQVAVADVNGDGVNDLFMSGSYSNPYVIYGKNGGWPATFDVNTVDGTTTGFAVNLAVHYPAWTDGSLTNNGTVADLNSDGKPDLLLLPGTSSPSGRTSAGALAVFYNGGSGWPAISGGNPASYWQGLANAYNTTFDGSNGFLAEGAFAGDWTGWPVVTRFTGGSTPNLIISAPSTIAGMGRCTLSSMRNNRGKPAP